MRVRKTKLNPFCTGLAALLLALWPVSVVAQQQQEPQQQSDQSSSASQAPSTKPDEKTADAASPKPDTDASKPAANKPTTPEEARQAQFLADSQKLYQLAQELKEEVAKSNKNTLSIAVTKKAEEIEKLAKSMKERMRKE